MAFKNPSLSSSIITEDEKNDIFDRLSRVEQSVQSLQKDINNKEAVKQESTIFSEQKEELPKEEYQILDKEINNATLNGNPRGLMIPFMEKKEEILPIPDFSQAISLEKENISNTVEQTKEEYTLLDISNYADKIYVSNSPQRRGTLNENQVNNILNIQNDKKDDVISIDNIMSL